LATAVEKLEAVLGPRQERLAPVDACSHCFTAEDLRALNGPVDEVPEGLFCSALHWGSTMDADVALWRKLTPRILRMLAEQGLHIDESWMARKFGEARWREWPEAERDAVSEFCEAWFATVLTASDSPAAVEVLPFIAVVYGELTHWLERWAATPGARSDQQLAPLAEWWLPDLLAGDLDISFSGDLPDISAELSAWLVAQAPGRLSEGDLEPIDAYRLSQLPLPADQRYRDAPAFDSPLVSAGLAWIPCRVSDYLCGIRTRTATAPWRCSGSRRERCCRVASRASRLGRSDTARTVHPIRLRWLGIERDDSAHGEV
jgi:hypothetical protein